MSEMIYKTHLVPVRVGGYGVLGSERYATSGDDQQDGHFKVPEVDHVVTHSTHPEGHTTRGNSVLQGVMQILEHHHSLIAPP